MALKLMIHSINNKQYNSIITENIFLMKTEMHRPIFFLPSILLSRIPATREIINKMTCQNKKNTLYIVVKGQDITCLLPQAHYDTLSGRSWKKEPMESELRSNTIVLSLFDKFFHMGFLLCHNKVLSLLLFSILDTFFVSIDECTCGAPMHT